jgi:hypothetical protein
MEGVLVNVAYIFMYQGECKGKSIPRGPVTGPEHYRKLRLPQFITKGDMNVIRFLALSTGRLFSAANISGTHFCCNMSLPQRHSAAFFYYCLRLFRVMYFGLVLFWYSTKDWVPWIFPL